MSLIFVINSVKISMYLGILLLGLVGSLKTLVSSYRLVEARVSTY